MTLPNFLVIGAGKAGTSSLYAYLGRHPQIFMSAIKETNFFVWQAQNPRIVGRSSGAEYPVRSLEAYRRLFEDAAGARAIGEASPRYLIDPRAAERIRHHLPDAKLIVVLRHPAERAYSAYSMYVRDRFEQRSFARAIAEEENGTCDETLRFGQKNYVGDGYYGRHLRPYFALFERSQIAVHLLEDLQADAAGLMRRLFGFLDVDDSFTTDTSSRHNSSGQPRNRLLRPLLHKSMLTRTLRHALPGPLRPRAEALQLAWRDRCAQLPPSVPPEVRHALIAKYRDDILDLQDLIRRDLSHWLA